MYKSWQTYHTFSKPGKYPGTHKIEHTTLTDILSTDINFPPVECSQPGNNSENPNIKLTPKHTRR